jgi:hypothetical protein
MSHVVRSEQMDVASDEGKLQVGSRSRLTVVIRGHNTDRIFYDK